MMSSNREQRAIDALLVSQLRSLPEDLASLPPLADDVREKLDSLGSDFIDRLLAGDVRANEPTVVDEPELQTCGENFGFNRAKDLDDTTREELDAKRKAIIERMKQIEENKDASENR